MVAPVFCDTETVRLASDQGSAVWEIAVIAGDEEYLWQVRPDLKRAEAGALQKGRYYERCRVADKPAGSGIVLAGPKLPKGRFPLRAAHLIAQDLAKLLDGVLIVGANPWFDAGHIDAFLREYGQALSADYHMRDIGSVVDGYLSGYDMARRNCEFCKHNDPGPPREASVSPRLADVAKAMGFNPDSWDLHTAIGDARLVKALWRAVTGS